MMKTLKIIFLLLFTASLCVAQQPNVVIIYVDDLGYGDLSCYGAQKVNTPNVDALADNGIRFTDSHSQAATCTPSRYSLLTGNYAFRINADVLEGDAPALIRPGTPTMAEMFKQNGYRTAVIGKWHLGLGNGDVDWNGIVSPGPLEIGFDYSYLIPATGDRVPCVILENHQVLNLDKDDPITVNYKTKVGNDPTGIEYPELLSQPADAQHGKTIVNGVSRIGYMTGGNAARWKDETIPYQMLSKARDFINKSEDSPFFLYFAFHDIHVPHMPDLPFRGATSMGLRGDAIVQMDYITGKLVDFLKKENKLDNTLIIFTSDNGPVLHDGYGDGAMELVGDHKPGGIYRGGKYSNYEAGTRVPFIVSYPQRVREATISDALIGQIDIYASMAELLGYELTNDEAGDSRQMLSTMLGEEEDGRVYLLEEAFSYAYRKGDWKYIKPVSDTQPYNWIKQRGIEDGNSTQEQLYNIKDDPQERHNVADKYPKIVKKLRNELDNILQ